MIHQSRVCAVLLLLGISSPQLFAQEKYEQESRLKNKAVPVMASSFIDSLDFGGKLNWFLEEGLSHKSIEAKFKVEGVEYSIEFDTLGKLEDAEIDLKWVELQVELKDSISSQLRADCSKQKVIKTQIQYSGTRSAVLGKLRTGVRSELLTVRYELVVKCRSESGIGLFEYLLDETGKTISRSKIVFGNSNHLEY